jgi:hypothetical protein
VRVAAARVDGMSAPEGCTCGLGTIEGGGLEHEATTTVMDCPAHADTEMGRAEAFISSVWTDIREL